MKNRGFTLLELLGVIVILALLTTLVFPSVLSVIKKASNKTDELSMKLISNAVDLFISENKNDYPIVKGNVFCIPLTKLQNTEYLNENILELNEIDVDNKVVKVTVIDDYDYEIVDKNQCEEQINTDSSCFVTTENSDGTLTITDYTCTYTDVIIPKIINGKTVTAIGRVAFRSNQLTSVSIPNSVTSIGQAAFTCNEMSEENAYIYNRNSDGTIDYTSLNSYAGSDAYIKRVIPDQVDGISLTHIGVDAFSGCKLYGEVIIPDGVTHIGSGAFQDNFLINIEIPDSVISIGYAAFNRNALKGDNEFIYNRNSDGTIDYTSLNSYAGSNQGDIIIPEEVNGVKLTNIGMDAFLGRLIEGVTIPDSVTSIGTGAFSSNRLTTITIPESVTSIGIAAFSSNRLTEVIIKGKTSSADFDRYGEGSDIWGWASGYSDSNITWNG